MLGHVFQFIIWPKYLQSPFSGIWTGSSLPRVLHSWGYLTCSVRLQGQELCFIAVFLQPFAEWLGHIKGDLAGFVFGGVGGCCCKAAGPGY